MSDVLEKTRPAKLSLIASMAAKYEMEPNAFADAVRKTAMPSNATNEEFAAFLMVAKEYRLNPLLHEIHAFPKKGGGITPVVSIDGWVSLINQHPAMNGMEFDYHENKNNQLVACTCRLYRKDRDRAIEVTEYLVECFRNTEPWKIAPKRMLRHKALIQAARYAFGFSGIYDDDEAQRINDMRDVSPAKPIATTTSALDRFAEVPATPVDLQYEADTGEIIEPSAADAYELGRQARDANKALRAVPGEMREPGQEKFADAWAEGWRSRDEEITHAAKQ
jgi:phage recombination protein Bet